MKASIPRLRESIKDASMRELNDFLENIRKYSPKIGELAMRHTAEKLNADPTFYGQQTKKQQVNSKTKETLTSLAFQTGHLLPLPHTHTQVFVHNL